MTSNFANFFGNAMIQIQIYKTISCEYLQDYKSIPTGQNRWTLSWYETGKFI